MFAVPRAPQAGLGLAGGSVGDLVFGDPRRLHPVAGFGWLAGRLEASIYAPTRFRGLAFTGLLVGLAAASAEIAARTADRCDPHPHPHPAHHPHSTPGRGRSVVLAAATWSSLGGRSIRCVAGRLASQLDAGQLDAARETLAALCGRDPDQLDAGGLARAAVESVAENTSDAVVAALLWGALAGPAGVAAHRAANTLDAMVGHPTARYREFGWAAARLDDVLNWPAARLTAILTALWAPLVGGSTRTTWATVRRDGSHHPSPNAGRVEAAFAGALGLRLGGPLTYAGVPETRPSIGAGARPTTTDVRRAGRLSLAVGVTAALCCTSARAAVVSWRNTALRSGGARPPRRSHPAAGVARRADRPAKRGRS